MQNFILDFCIQSWYNTYNDTVKISCLYLIFKDFNTAYNFITNILNLSRVFLKKIYFCAYCPNKK